MGYQTEQGKVKQRLRIGAVLLAAGKGSRLGDMPKCLFTLEGVPLLQRHLTALKEAGIDEVVVVSGHYHARVEPALAGFPVTLVRNPDPERGQHFSVQLGLEALGAGLDLVLVVLADQPLVGRAELVELICAFKQRPDGCAIVYPEVAGQRGNPVAFGGALMARMVADGSHANCRKFIDTHPELVHKLATANEHFVLDLDTPDDLAAFEQRTGSKLELPAAG